MGAMWHHGSIGIGRPMLSFRQIFTEKFLRFPLTRESRNLLNVP
jgi:hypothetical protein